MDMNTVIDHLRGLDQTSGCAQSAVLQHYLTNLHLQCVYGLTQLDISSYQSNIPRNI